MARPVQDWDEYVAEMRVILTGTSLRILESLDDLRRNDPRFYEGLVSKIVERSGATRTEVLEYLKQVRSARASQ